MKKILFKTSSIFLISICFYSCCIELKFDKDETYWTDTYEKGDIIVFKSDSLEKNKKTNRTDTIFILNKTHNIPTGDCNLMVSNYDVEGCVIDYNYKHDTILSEPNLFVQHFKEKEGESLPILRVYDMEFSGKSVKDTTVMLKIGKKLNDCYTFHSRDGYKGWSNFKLKKFVWSREIGLVMFIGENGEKFEFLKKIRKK